MDWRLRLRCNDEPECSREETGRHSTPGTANIFLDHVVGLVALWGNDAVATAVIANTRRTTDTVTP